MQTLGLSSETKRSDGRLKSIFWPTVESAWDVNYLGQQGFWICTAIGIFQLIGTTMLGTTLFVALGLVAFLIFFLGGMGVREASWPAAALVFAIYLSGIVDAFSKGHPPGVLAIIGVGILLSNVRAAFLASEWRPATEGEDRPTRFNESFSDKLVDQLPAKVWPVLKVPFFILASLYLMLILAAFAVDIVNCFGAV